MTGELVCGPETLSEDGARAEPRRHVGRTFSRARSTAPITGSASADLSKVTVPLLSAANWGGQGLHPRGNFEGFTRAASRAEMAGGARRLALGAVLHRLRRRSCRSASSIYFLKGEQNGWDRQPRVLLQVRHPGEKFVERARERVAARAHAVDAASISIRQAHALHDRTGEVRRRRVDLRRPGRRRHVLHAAARAGDRDHRAVALKLWISSSTADADIFAVLRVFDPQGKELVFQGALDPHTPIAQGWLRASQRKLDPRALAPLPPVSHARREAAADARRGLRARRRDLADLHRGARRAGASRSRSAARTTSTKARRRCSPT